VKKTALLPLCALLVLVTLTYANHFGNSFHFDDSHTVQENPYIRDLRNIPRIFTDANTFSTLPANRTWRPIVTASLAVDYWLGGGLKPFFFQASTFFWFLVQLCLMYGVFLKACDFARPDSNSRTAICNRWVALFAVAVYGFHPAIAETVNYVIQRGDVYSTLGVVAGIFLYAYRPDWRRYGIYLIPVVLALLSKPPALIFPAILFVWIRLFPPEATEDRKPAPAVRQCMPALLVAAVFAILSSAMSPKSFTPSTTPAGPYVMTQPLVALRYFASFFLPIHLSADTDHVAVRNIFEDGAWLGFLFVMALIAVAIRCSKRRELRPIAFGLYWFVLALIPTSVFPLAEVENDHRMFFPFVGLALSVSWAAALWLYAHPVRQEVVAAVCGIVLVVAAWGTIERNKVWHTEESLWRDVAEKSPRNGRGLMNYGLSLMGRGDYWDALSYFQRASILTPNYMVLEVNLGIVYGALNNDAEAERHFQHAIDLGPADAVPNYFYAAWLKKKGRTQEAVQRLNVAVASNPSYLDAEYLLMNIFAESRDSADLRKAAMKTLEVSPSDSTARSWLARADDLGENPPPQSKPQTPEDWLNRSLSLYQQGKFEDSASAAQEALKLRPDYAPAWNNIAAASNAQGKWDEGIRAGQQAVRLDPNFQLAKNNLAWAVSQKQKSK
jgi:protein O-mannosyl-transferase